MEIFNGIVKEEIERLESLKKRYEHDLEGYMRGCLIKKNIKGNFYYYLNYRDKKKKIFKYLGRLNEDEVLEIERKIEKRRKIKNLLSQIKIDLKRLKKVYNEEK